MPRSLYRRFLARFSDLADEARLTIRETDLRDRCRVQADRIAKLEDENETLTQQLKIARGENDVLAKELALLASVNVRALEWIRTIRDTEEGDARPLAALRSLDEGDRVIYVGTFSKAMFPSLRLGYLVVPAGLRGDFVNAKWQDDFGSCGIEQAALARFIVDGGFERHLRRAWKTLKERRAALLDGLEQCSRGRLRVDDSHAGMHLVVWLKDRSAAEGEAFIAHARGLGLGLYPIAPYYLQPPDRAGLLLGYCGLSVAEIHAAVALFATCLDEFDAAGT